MNIIKEEWQDDLAYEDSYAYFDGYGYLKDSEIRFLQNNKRKK